MTQDISTTQTLKFKIPPNGLLDFTVTSSPIQFKMTQGKDAEVHGYPLTKNKEYTVSAGGIGIYSWKGCQVQLCGNFMKNDKAQPTLIKESPIKHYLMAHSKLYKIRSELSEIETEKKDFKLLNYSDLMNGNWSDFDIQRQFLSHLSVMGPRMLVLGSVNTGKSTLCKSLLNWAQRLRDEPIYIDLDCGQNSLSIPGTLCGETVTDYRIPWQGGQDSLAIPDNAMFNPFVYYFGHISPSHNARLYKHYISVLSQTMKKKMLSFDQQRRCGAVINTCGFVEGALAQSIIKHIISAFAVNYVIVMECEGKASLLRFLDCVSKEVKHGNISIFDAPPSKSVQIRPQNQRYLDRQRMCRHYFYGESERKWTENEFRNEYTAFERVYGFNELRVFEVLKVCNININNSDCSSNNSSSDSNSIINEKGKKRKKGKGKYGNHNRNRVTDVTYKYCNGLAANNFQIKSKRFDEHMSGYIIAVTHAQSVENLLTSNVAGFIYVKHVCKEKKEIRVLQSCVGDMPGLCLFGNVKWDRDGH